jgi:hypothetical protein
MIALAWLSFQTSVQAQAIELNTQNLHGTLV